MTQTLRRARKIYSLRLSAKEHRLLEAAAAEGQEYMSEYIRRTALRAARETLSEHGTGRGRGGGTTDGVPAPEPLS